MSQRKENPEDIARARRNFVWTFVLCTGLWIIFVISTGGL